MADHAYLQQLTRKLADEGRLIESGWVSFRLLAMDPEAPPDQVREMRLAWIASAQHLFASIIGMLDPESEPTANDERRMDRIAAELDVFKHELELRFGKPAGRG